MARPGLIWVMMTSNFFETRWNSHDHPPHPESGLCKPLTLSSLLYCSIWPSLSVVSLSRVSSWSFSLRQFTPFSITLPVSEVKATATRQKVKGQRQEREFSDQYHHCVLREQASVTHRRLCWGWCFAASQSASVVLGPAARASSASPTANTEAHKQGMKKHSWE